MERNNINMLFDFLNLGKIESISVNDSSQNVVYKVRTNSKIYDVKEFSHDAISSLEDLNKRQEQLRISEILNESNINCSIPIKFNDKEFVSFDGHYYLIYEHLNMKYLGKEKLNNEHLRVLAKTLAKIHLLDISSNLKCSYQNIEIDFNKYLDIYKIKNRKVYEMILNNLESLNKLINNVNSALENTTEKLVISHNDYKPLNVLWNGMKLILLDFDACGLSYPSACMCESAFTFSYMDGKIDHDRYKVFVEAYLKQFGKKDINYLNSIYISFNGKLQWLAYMLSNSEEENNPYDDGIISMINELITYYNDVCVLFEIINESKRS